MGRQKRMTSRTVQTNNFKRLLRHSAPGVPAYEAETNRENYVEHLSKILQHARAYTNATAWPTLGARTNCAVNGGAGRPKALYNFIVG